MIKIYLTVFKIDPTLYPSLYNTLCHTTEMKEHIFDVQYINIMNYLKIHVIIPV